MADINNIETIEDLLEVVADYCKTPRTPKLKGSELGIILTKMIELLPGAEVPEPITPSAPTSGVVDDDLDTFGFTLSSGYILSQHEFRYKITGGTFTTYATCTENPIQLPDADIAIGDVEVRVKAIGINNPSAVLSNSTAFTEVVTGPIAPTVPLVNDDNKTFTFTPNDI